MTEDSKDRGDEPAGSTPHSPEPDVPGQSAPGSSPQPAPGTGGRPAPGTSAQPTPGSSAQPASGPGSSFGSDTQWSRQSSSDSGATPGYPGQQRPPGQGYPGYASGPEQAPPGQSGGHPVPESGGTVPGQGGTAPMPPYNPYAPHGQQPGYAGQQPGGYGPAAQYPGGHYGVAGADPGQPHGDPGAPTRRRSGRTGLLVGAVVLALVAGGIGGAVGTLATRNDNTAPVTNALNAPAPADPASATAPPGSVPSVAQKVLPSVVMIRVASARGGESGSGVVLSSDGLILTNNHVASGGGPNSKMQVAFQDGSTADASIVGIDPISDLAVIKAEGKNGLTPVELGTSDNLKVGQSVVAIGSPLGLAGTVTTGIVSALDRPVSTSGETGSQGTVISAIQTDAAINPGNSGGALVDTNGKLVGINTAIATMGAGEMGGGQSGSIGLGFAIPVDQARRVADELIKTGHATYAQIGITVRAVDDVNGARVLDVTRDGPAAAAGIPPGAIVTKVGDQIIDSGNSLIAAVRSHQPGDKIKVTYTDPQGQNPKTVEVTLGAAPAEGGR